MFGYVFVFSLSLPKITTWIYYVFGCMWTRMPFISNAIVNGYVYTYGIRICVFFYALRIALPTVMDHSNLVQITGRLHIRILILHIFKWASVYILDMLLGIITYRV